MPNNHETLTSLFEDIADAIREKTGSEAEIVADEFPEAIAAIPTGGGEDLIQHAQIPEYVKTEALALAEKVRERQTANSITFIVGSDSHQNDTLETVVNGNLHAGMAMKILAYALKLDFAAFLGDYTTGNPTTTDSQTGVVTPGTTIAEGLQHIAEINDNLAEPFKGLPQFRTTGNHDPLTFSWSTNDNDYLSEAELYPLIGAFNGIDNETVFGDTTAGYCYRDFPAKKVRVICLNTAENTSAPSADGSSEMISAAQQAWFKNVLLDVGDKGADWSVIILSHHPLDWDWGVIKPASNMLGDYVAGNGDFHNHNLARVIGAFHGHTHCYKYARLKSAGTEYDAYRIAIPNMCFGRNNEYGRYNHNYDYGETVSYDKTANSANDTAFCAVVVDLEQSIIFAYHYGAGPAANAKCRAIPYDFSTTYYPVKTTAIKAEIRGAALVAAGSTYRATVIPGSGMDLSRFDADHVKIMHNGVNVTSSAYNPESGEIVISNVSGPISIDAAPFINLVPTSTTDDQTTIFNGTGSLEGWRLNSSGALTQDGADPTAHVSGFIPYDGTKQTLPVVRIAQLRDDYNFTWQANYVQFYKYQNGQMVLVSNGAWPANNGQSFFEGVSMDNRILTFDPNEARSGFKTAAQNAEFIRCSIATLDANNIPFVITIDEDIIY